MSRGCVVVAVLGVQVAACSGPTPSPAAFEVRYSLPADPLLTPGPGQTPRACGGVGLEAVVRGSPIDARHVWLVDTTAGGRIDLVWQAKPGS